MLENYYAKPAGVTTFSMLAWLLAVPCLVSGMLLPAANKLTTLADIPSDSLIITLGDLGFVSALELSLVSKRFRKVLFPVIQSLYEIKWNGKVYLNHGTIIHEFKALQAHAYREHDEFKARTVLEGSPEYMGIKATLETEFGACIRYNYKREGEFLPELSLLEMLYNERKASALPYLLDGNPNAPEWASCINELAERGRFDILSQLKFPCIREREFCSLLSIPLPTTVVMAAARSLQRNESGTNLAKLVAHGVLQDNDASVLEGPADLFILQHMHENQMPIPQDWVFKNGVLEQSISFWMYLMGKEAGEVQALLGIILERGDDNTKCLASVFYQVVLSDDMPAGAEDVFQAMLIRFRFSPHSNDYVRANYEVMIKRQLTIGSHSIHALLDCGQSELISQFEINLYLWDDENVPQGLVAKMCRLGDKNLPTLLECFLGRSSSSERLWHFKNLIKERADDQYTQLVWDWIQSNGQFNTIEDNCCLMPVHSLKRLMFEKDISVAAVEEMLNEGQGYQYLGDIISEETAIFCTVMYWEAPEEVVIHFLDQLSPDCSLNLSFIYELSRSTKYSIRLWGRLVKGSGLWMDRLKRQFGYYRPDLLSLFN